MAEGILMGAALGGGTAMLTGNDPLKGAAIGGIGGGIGGNLMTSNPFAGEALSQGVSSTVNPALLSAGTEVGSTVAANTMNPALTNGLGESSNMLTQFGRDASGYMGDMGDTIGQGFDYMNDKTGMENKDWTQMAMNQGINSMQPDPQQQLQAAPMGTGISRPQVDLSQSRGSLLSSNPLTSGPGGQAMTQKDYELLKQGLL